MLSETAVSYLSALSYRANAERRVCVLPLSGIYWEDEIPDILQLARLSEDDQNQVWRLFGLRARIWRGESLSPDDQLFWDKALSRVPGCPLFYRLQISAEDRKFNDEVEGSTAKELEELFNHAEQVSLSEAQPGVQRFSATFDLTGGRPTAQRKKSWWSRLLGKRRAS